MRISHKTGLSGCGLAHRSTLRMHWNSWEDALRLHRTLEPDRDICLWPSGRKLQWKPPPAVCLSVRHVTLLAPPLSLEPLSLSLQNIEHIWQITTSSWFLTWAPSSATTRPTHFWTLLHFLLKSRRSVHSISIVLSPTWNCLSCYIPSWLAIIAF